MPRRYYVNQNITVIKINGAASCCLRPQHITLHLSRGPQVSDMRDLDYKKQLHDFIIMDKSLSLTESPTH